MSSHVTATAPRVQSEALRYSNVWEDAAVLRRVLAVRPGDRVLSIASAGDNVLALLLDDPCEVVAVDVSALQLALCELKMRSLEHLETDHMHAFMGFAPAPRAWRLQTRQHLRASLSPRARTLLDAQTSAIASGIVHAGRLEEYFRVFSRVILPLVQSRATRRAMWNAADTHAQQQVFAQQWNHRLWRTLLRVFFAKASMKRGRDAAFLRFTNDDVGNTILCRAERTLCTLPVRASLYTAWLLCGGPSTAHLPPWAERQHRATLVERLSRVRPVHGDRRQVAAHEAAHQRFDAMNLSDVFEYMSPEDSSATWATLAQAATPQARLLWWWLLVDRRPGACDALALDDDGARALWAADAGFFMGGWCSRGPPLVRGTPFPERTRMPTVLHACLRVRLRLASSRESVRFLRGAVRGPAIGGVSP